MRRWIMAGALASASTTAMAADKPLYQPAPDWVKPAPALDPATITDASPVLLLVDNQQRLKDGQVWTYTDMATRMATSEVLGQAGTVTLDWAPDKGDLIVHRAEIIRGTEHIDLLKTGKGFQVIRREQGLEKRQLDGLLSATMAVEGLRVGDILHVTLSKTATDPVLKGGMQAFMPLMISPVRVFFARTRLLWPEAAPIHWKVLAADAVTHDAKLGAMHELTVETPVPRQPELPDDAPMRFRHLPIVEAGNFADWSAVSTLMAPLYVTDGLIAPGSPLAAEVATITAAETDPLKRTALALRLVQDKVRYLFNGMDAGNYVPQTPAQTWALRYGDCKAKTMLLLAILHAMGIEAEPVLANTELGGLVSERLPQPGAFNHVLVKAAIGGRTLWLDGTDGGTRLADLNDTPPFRMVLPIRAGGATLMPLAMHAPARPDMDSAVEIDESAGINLPAPMKVTITVRGQTAAMLRAGSAQAGKDDIKRVVASIVDKLVPSNVVSARTMTFDDTTGTETITATGIAFPDWQRQNERLQRPIERTVADLKFEPDRARAAWAAMPVSTGNPAHFHYLTRVRLPDGGKGFTLEGDRSLPSTLAGATVTRRVDDQGGWITVDDRITTAGVEIAAADVAATRQRLDTAKARLLTMDAPTDYPGLTQRIEATRRAHGFAALDAAYAAVVADMPDEATAWAGRAWYEDRIFDRKAAIADLTKAIALKPDAATYLWRARLLTATGAADKAMADIVAARALDPSSEDALVQLANLQLRRGQKEAALAMVQERIDQGGKTRPQMMALKADLLAKAGDRDAALTTIDQAVAAAPGNAQLLNSRCWIKATLATALDTALKDCTRAIELSDSVAAAALDSRAMVYYRMKRPDDALTDLAAVLEGDPDKAASLFMRGVIRGQTGHGAEGKADVAAARIIAPLIDTEYTPFGIVAP